MHVGKYRGVLDQKSASLSNDDGDANENGRKAVRINWQNNVHHAILVNGQDTRVILLTRETDTYN